MVPVGMLEHAPEHRKDASVRQDFTVLGVQVNTILYVALVIKYPKHMIACCNVIND